MKTIQNGVKSGSRGRADCDTIFVHFRWYAKFNHFPRPTKSNQNEIRGPAHLPGIAEPRKDQRQKVIYPTIQVISITIDGTS